MAAPAEGDIPPPEGEAPLPEAPEAVETPPPDATGGTPPPPPDTVDTLAADPPAPTPPAAEPSPEAVAAADDIAIPTEVPTPSATSNPTVPPSPTPDPTESLVVVPPTLPVLTHEERWRNQQLNREPFTALRDYTTSGSELWWYDPVNQQHVILGSFAGDFRAQATFTLRGQGLVALEVPYNVNESYGLTSVSSVLVDRIRQAGFDEWIETYVFLTPNVQPQ
jgi:hypothetical protein